MAATTACGRTDKAVTSSSSTSSTSAGESICADKPGSDKAGSNKVGATQKSDCISTQPVPPRLTLDDTVTEKAPETTAPTTRARNMPWLTKADEPRLAIIIDDWGQQKYIEDDFLEMDIPLTVAVIPFLTRSAKDAGLAAAAGFDVLLHLPMEPDDASLANVAGIVTTAMTDAEIKSAVSKALANVPSVVGVNNHMGSKATANERVMGVVLDELDKAQLFFLDSKTTANTVAAGIGDATGVPVLERNIFLDGSSDISYIHGQLLAAAHLAKSKGYAIAIGHVRPNTAQALRESLAEIEELGVRLVRVSQLVQGAGAAAETAASSEAEAVDADKAEDEAGAGVGKGAGAEDADSGNAGAGD